MGKKKFLVLATSIALILALMLPLACGPAPSKAEWPEQLVITAPTSGSLKIYGAGVAKIIEEQLGIPTSLQEQASSLAAGMKMIKGDAPICGTTGAETVYALLNKEPFPLGSSSTMRGLFFGEYHSTCHWMVRADSDIYAVSDLKGKRCMFSRPGQALYQDNWAAVLEAYGMTEDDIILMPALGSAEAVQALVEGRADAFFCHGAAPIAAIVEASITTPFRLLPLSDEAINHLLEKVPWTMVEIIPAGTYKGQDKDIKWTASKAGIMVSKDLPDDLVYEIVKAVDENMSDLCSVHKAFEDWTFKGLVNNTFGPYHAGAYKYYIEKGLLTDKSKAMHEYWLKEIGEEK